MPKAKSHPDQFGFTFEAPAPATGEADLAGLEQMTARTVGQILNSDQRPREIIAAEMSVLLDEEVSRSMLDAYSSPARNEHKVIFSRFIALVVVTKRFDMLDRLMRKVGAAVVVGDEINTVRLGHVARQIKKLQAEERELKAMVPLMRGESD